METLKKILMRFAKETKGLKKATSVEIDEEMGAVFFKVGNSEIEVNQVTLMLWMSKLNIHNVRERLIYDIKSIEEQHNLTEQDKGILDYAKELLNIELELQATR